MYVQCNKIKNNMIGDNIMNVGEKIKYYRELRGLSQQQLAEFSGIPLGTLKKYEIGNRNPKQEPLQRIANALHISISSFHDINLQTIGDVAPYLFAIAKTGKVKFHGSKDEDGKYDINSLSISFESSVLKHFLKEWADSKVVIDHLREESINSPDETTKLFLLNRADEIEQELELRMVDSQMLIQSQKIRSLIGSLLVNYNTNSCIFYKLQAFCKHKAQKPFIYRVSGLNYIIRILS